MKPLIISALLAGLLSLSGCVMGLHKTLDYNAMSPEQIKSLQELAMDVYSCVTISGPPPTGRAVYILVPRLDKKADVRFGEGCLIR